MLAVGLAMIPASGVIVLTGLQRREQGLATARAEALRQAESFAELQSRTTATTRQLLQTLAALPGFRRRDVVQMSEIIAAVHAANPEYLNFTVLDENGYVETSILIPPGTDLSLRADVAAAVRERRFVAGGYIINPVDAAPSVAYAMPVFGYSDALIGVVAASVDLRSYAAVFNRLTLPRGSVLGLVDRNGLRLFYHPRSDTNPIGGKIKSDIWEKIQAGDDSGFFAGSGSDGVGRIYAYKKLRLEPDRNPYIYVVYAAPLDRAYDAADAALRFNIALMLAVAGIGVAGAAGLAKYLFGDRLGRIVETASRLREGNLSARVGLDDDPSDLGQIATALDRMAAATERRERERIEHATAVSAALAEKEILLKEIHHRVKNNLQLIQSLLSLQADSTGSLEDFEKRMSARIRAIAMVHQMIYETESLADIGLGAYAKRLCESVSTSLDIAIRVHSTKEADGLSCDLDTAVPFGLLLNELLACAYSRSREDSVPVVTLDAEGPLVTLEVAIGPQSEDDDAAGDSGAEDDASLGYRLAKALASQLRGTFCRSESDFAARYDFAFSVEPSGITLGDDPPRGDTGDII